MKIVNFPVENRFISGFFQVFYRFSYVFTRFQVLFRFFLSFF